MSERITYDDKVSLTTSQLPRVNKCTDTDLNEIKSVVNSHADELELIQEDSGWLQVTLTNQFQAYNEESTNIPKYRKVGNLVEIRGIVAPTSNIPAGTSPVIAFTLPSGFRPSGSQRYFICQGSGRNVWLLTVYPDGNVGVSRYGTTSIIDIPTTAWLPFNAVFMVG